MTDTVTVPREPTEEMLVAGGRAVEDFYSCGGPYPRAKAMYRAMLAAAPKAEPVDAEVYLKEAISSSPQPLQDLGEFLSSVLDEDQWKAADRLLLAIATSQPEAQKGEPVGEVVLFGGDLKEIAWRKGKLPPVGAKLYTHPAPSSELLELIEDAEPIIQVLLEDRETAIGGECEVAGDLLKRVQSAIAKHKGPQS